MIQLGEDVLNRAWKEWNIKYSATQLYNTSYARVSRRIPFAQQFETMLFKEGAIIQRINKKCYLQFTDPEEALMFRLRYA
jgi:hypothetical protein